MRGALILFLFVIMSGCQAEAPPPLDPQTEKLVRGALNQIGETLYYDPSYRKLDYPGGDLPLEYGVCTDVVIRALRHAGVDLQVLVHEDMSRAFARYPQNWGLKSTDRNIDHRRVANLRVFFQRQGKSLPISDRPEDYRPGDLITWTLPNGLAHIGVLSDRRDAGDKHWLVVHNIGAGARLEDVLFEFEITGHYRYFDLPSPR